MDSLIYPFFWTWKVSLVLPFSLVGNTRIHPPLFWFLLTIGFSASTLSGHEHRRQCFLFFHIILFATKFIPISWSSGFVLRYHHGSICSCGRVRSLGPCSGDGVLCTTRQIRGLFFPQFIGTLGFQLTSDRTNVGLPRTFHFLVMVFLFYFSYPSPRDYECSFFIFIYYYLQSLTTEAAFGLPTVALERLVTTFFVITFTEANQKSDISFLVSIVRLVQPHRVTLSLLSGLISWASRTVGCQLTHGILSGSVNPWVLTTAVSTVNT